MRRLAMVASLLFALSGPVGCEDDPGQDGGLPDAGRQDTGGKLDKGSADGKKRQASCGNGICEAHVGPKETCSAAAKLCAGSNAAETKATCPEDCPLDPKIIGVKVDGGRISKPHFGDLFMTTWGNSKLFVSWGDGTGMGKCFPSYDMKKPFPEWSCVEDPNKSGCFLIGKPCANKGDCVEQHFFCETFGCGKDCIFPCPWSDSGLLVFTGTVPTFDACTAPTGCVKNFFVPTGKPPWKVDLSGGKPKLVATDRDDKPSSLLYLNKRLYAALHTPLIDPIRGYIAYSDDDGATWKEVDFPDWKKPSPFRVLMFINMGPDYSYAKDDHVYALGMGVEIGWSREKVFHGTKEREEKTVYLTRVPKDGIPDKDKYRYFAGVDKSGNPVWSKKHSDAIPVPGLQSVFQASAMYHKGADRFLFLTSLPGGLYEAITPWGPWIKVASLFGKGEHPTWNTYGYVPGVITKDAGKDSFHFTLADQKGHYNLSLGKMVLTYRP